MAFQRDVEQSRTWVAKAATSCDSFAILETSNAKMVTIRGFHAVRRRMLFQQNIYFQRLANHKEDRFVESVRWVYAKRGISVPWLIRDLTERNGHCSHQVFDLPPRPFKEGQLRRVRLYRCAFEF